MAYDNPRFELYLRKANPCTTYCDITWSGMLLQNALCAGYAT